jgi:hypothetical protein
VGARGVGLVMAGACLLVGCGGSDDDRAGDPARAIPAKACEELVHAGVEVAAAPLEECVATSFTAQFECDDGRPYWLVGTVDGADWFLIVGGVPIESPVSSPGERMTEAQLRAPREG